MDRSNNNEHLESQHAMQWRWTRRSSSGWRSGRSSTLACSRWRGRVALVGNYAEADTRTLHSYENGALADGYGFIAWVRTHADLSDLASQGKLLIKLQSTLLKAGASCSQLHSQSWLKYFSVSGFLVPSQGIDGDAGGDWRGSRAETRRVIPLP